MSRDNTRRQRPKKKKKCDWEKRSSRDTDPSVEPNRERDDLETRRKNHETKRNERIREEKDGGRGKRTKKGKNDDNNRPPHCNLRTISVLHIIISLRLAAVDRHLYLPEIPKYPCHSEIPGRLLTLETNVQGVSRSNLYRVKLEVKLEIKRFVKKCSKLDVCRSVSSRAVSFLAE